MDYYRRKPLAVPTSGPAKPALERIAKAAWQSGQGAVALASAAQGAPGIDASRGAPRYSANGDPGDRARTATPAATDLVPAAAEVLDEEIANGWAIARQIPSTAATGESPVVQRAISQGTGFLREVHDLVDALGEMFPGAQQGIAASTPTRDSPENSARGDRLGFLRPAILARPGGTALMTFGVANDGSRPVCVVAYCTELLHPSGARIGADNMKFDPEELELAPGDVRSMTLHVSIPADAEAGRYVGVLVASGLDDLRAIVELQVR